MLAFYVALVSQTSQISLGQLSVAASALQKQVNRDFSRYWGITATVSAFEKLSHAPLDYWKIIIRDDIQVDGAAGIHLNRNNGQPYALVQYSSEWSLTLSHELLEMLADPQGNRVVAGDSVKAGQGRVQYLVEVCDPSERAQFGYSVNGVLVSDFYTPAFFDPVFSPSARYSFTGCIKKPRQVLNGGYLSWLHPPTRHLWQLFVVNGKQVFKDRGPLPNGFASLRSVSDAFASSEPGRKTRGKADKSLLLFASSRAGDELETAYDAEADGLQEQITAVLAGDPDGAGQITRPSTRRGRSRGT